MIRINGIDYDQVQAGYQVRESKTNELASCVVIVYTKTKPDFKIYDLVEFDNRKWFLSVKNTIRKKEYYQINLTLVELTFILEKFILPPCSFTNPTDILRFQMIKAFRKIKPLRSDESHGFSFSIALSKFLQGKPGEDFEYPERMTLREVLDDMLSPYGLRITVDDIIVDANKNITSIVLGYLDLNEKSNDIKTLGKVSTEEEMESAEFYADVLDISVQNTQSKKKIIAKEQWQTMKPTSIAAGTDDSLRLVVSNPVEEITSVIIMWETIIYEMVGNEAQLIAAYVDVTYDIIDLFIEQEIYDTMPLTEQEKYIPYQRGSKEIGVLEYYKIAFFTISKLSQFIIDNQAAIAKKYLDENNIEYNPNGDFILDRPSASELKTKVLFKVEYAPYLDFNFKQSKDNKEVNIGITSISNQTNRNTDIDRYTRSVRSLANTIGNAEMNVDVVVKDKTKLLNLGDRIDNEYSVVRREYQVFNDFVKCRYTLMKNYQTNISARLSRERRLYNIPSESLVDRALIIKDKLLISTNPIHVFNDSMLSNETLTLLVKSFDNSYVNTDRLENVLIQTIDGTNFYPGNSGWFSLNFIGRALGKSIIWQAGMYDNYSVGLSSGSRTWGGRIVHLTPYVNDKGEVDQIRFSFIKNKLEQLEYLDQLIIGASLPVIAATEVPKYIEQSYSHSTSRTYTIAKDRLEVLRHIVYQLEAQQYNDDKIVVGNYFMEIMNLLENKNTEPLYIWTSVGKTYTSSDTELCKGDRTTNIPLVQTDEGVYRVYTDYSNLVTRSSWAIGFEDGRLIVAINNNKQEINSIHFGLQKD